MSDGMTDRRGQDVTTRPETLMHPSVGRVVHYYHEGETHPTAAIITYVWADDIPGESLVNLALLEPTGTAGADGVLRNDIGHRSNVVQSSTPRANCWTAPPRV